MPAIEICLESRMRDVAETWVVLVMFFLMYARPLADLVAALAISVNYSRDPREFGYGT